MAMAPPPMLVALDDAADAMQCPDHPYRTNPGGVCAFCLQEKLGKLVSSSSTSFSPLPHPASSPSTASSAPPSPPRPAPPDARRPRIPFLHRKKKNKTKADEGGGNRTSTLARSRSVVSARPPAKPKPAAFPVPVGVGDSTPLDSPRKRWFWSFLLHHPGPNPRSGLASHPQSSKISGLPCADPPPPSNPRSALKSVSDASRRVQSTKISSNDSSPYPPPGDVNNKIGNVAKAGLDVASVAKTDADDAAPEKVGRSRSVGCGNRSFSGDFLERISTGLGDCTLRRVESHREGKAASAAGGGGGKVVLRRMSVSGPTADEADSRRGRPMARCAGILGMAMAAAAPPCPAYWAVAAGADEDVAGGGSSRGTPRARGRGWGWAFASPIRALRPGARGHVDGSQGVVGAGERRNAVTGGSASSPFVAVRG